MYCLIIPGSISTTIFAFFSGEKSPEEMF